MNKKYGNVVLISSDKKLLDKLWKIAFTTTNLNTLQMGVHGWFAFWLVGALPLFVVIFLVEAVSVSDS